MKKVATNTLATLVLISMISLSNMNVSAFSSKQGDNDDKAEFKRLERVYQHHDRKHELRASVLGISAEELRTQLKAKSLDTIVKKHGFKNKQSFYTALTGKLKSELRRRGWSEKKIEESMSKRLSRLASSPSKSPVYSV